MTTPPGSTPQTRGGVFEQNSTDYQPCDLSAGSVNLYLDNIAVQRTQISATGTLAGNVSIVLPPYAGAEYEIDDETVRAGHTITAKTPLGAGIVLPAGVRSRVVCKADGSDYVFAAGSGSVAGSEESVIIFRPGVPSSGNQVATWAEVQAAILAANGAILVYVDDRDDIAIVDVGITDCRHMTTFAAALVNSTVPISLHLQDGAVLKNVREFTDNLIVYSASTATASFDFDDYPSGPILTISNSALVQLDSSSTHSAFDVPAGDTLTFRQINGGKIDAALAPADTCIVSLGAASTLAIYSADNWLTPIGVDCVKGPVGSSLALLTDDSFDLPSPTTLTSTQANMLGTVVVNRHTTNRYQNTSRGTTGNRPTDAVVGQQYFDTTIGQWINWTGSVWQNLISGRTSLSVTGLAGPTTVITLPASGYLDVTGELGADVDVQCAAPAEGTTIKVSNRSTAVGGSGNTNLLTWGGLWIEPGGVQECVYLGGAWRYGSGSGKAFVFDVSITSANAGGTTDTILAAIPAGGYQVRDCVEFVSQAPVGSTATTSVTWIAAIAAPDMMIAAAVGAAAGPPTENTGPGLAAGFLYSATERQITQRCVVGGALATRAIVKYTLTVVKVG